MISRKLWMSCATETSSPTRSSTTTAAPSSTASTASCAHSSTPASTTTCPRSRRAKDTTSAGTRPPWCPSCSATPSRTSGTAVRLCGARHARQVHRDGEVPQPHDVRARRPGHLRRRAAGAAGGRRRPGMPGEEKRATGVAAFFKTSKRYQWRTTFWFASGNLPDYWRTRRSSAVTPYHWR